MEIKEYNDITVAEMTKVLKDLNIKTDSKDKKEVYEVYSKALSKEEKIEEKEIKKEERVEIKKAPRVARKIEPNELIEVRSVTENGLTYVSPKTGLKVTWGRYGDVEYLDFSEIMTMRSMSRKFLEKPYVVIEDEDVVLKLGLNRIYDNVLTKEEAQGFLALPLEEMKKQIKELPEGSRELIGETAISEVGTTFNDINKIKFLEKELNVGLTYILKD